MITLKAPYFSAGHKFKWKWTPVGFGVDYKELHGSGELEVMLKGKPFVYAVDRSVAKDVVEKLSLYDYRKGVKLGIVPKDLFSIKKQIVENIHKVEKSQLTLF